MNKEIIPVERIAHSFQLTSEERRKLRFQTAISKRRGSLRDLSYAFTEQGIVMLSSVLDSERAMKVKLAVMRVFVRLHQVLETNRELVREFVEVEKRVDKHDEEIAAILEAIRQLMVKPEKPRREIGFHVRETAPLCRVRKRA